MKAPAKIPVHTTDQAHTSMRAPAGSPSIDARVAANDEVQSKTRDTPENPLWAINVAMAAFFVVAALVMMTS